MLKNLFNKRGVSTKNLYFAALRKCVVKEFVDNECLLLCSYNYEFEVIKRIILVKKIRENCYQDIFTKNIYRLEVDYCEIGDFLINVTTPAFISASYITYDEAAELLNWLNSKDFEKDEVKDDSANQFKKVKK